MSERSRIPGFYRLSLPLRHARLAERFDLDGDELASLSSHGGLASARADKMVENCIGTFSLPIGLGLNFCINGRDYAVPMVVEEPSVVAAVSNTALLVRRAGGFEADADPALMVGQVQLVNVPDLEAARVRILEARDRILLEANALQPGMRARRQGARELTVHVFHEPTPMLVAHLVIDCGEAMGANAINSMAEGVAPSLEELSGGDAVLRILSNLADQRLARARCVIPEAALANRDMSGAQVAERIVHAYALAAVDPYRAATHNKGVMNGVDAVAIATGNDWRSVEAGAHAFAARTGAYRPLSRFHREEGALHGEIELPMAVGNVGGSTLVHPTVAALRKILGVTDARELAGVMAAVGLAQNLGALRALATVGIQRGHMRLHARSIAISAGAPDDAVERIARLMVERGEIRRDAAERLLAAEA